MGEIVHPDRALHLGLMLAISRILEEEWKQVTSLASHWNLAMEASLYLIGFCCALRGEEIPLANLYGVAVHWAEAENHRLKHTFDEKEIKCGPLF